MKAKVSDVNDALTRDPKTHELLIGKVKAKTLARRYGTPLYVYDYDTLLANFRRIESAFAEVNPLIAFSMKCNSNAAVLRGLIQAGSGLDIVSGGELSRGLAAGVDPGKVIFAGVGKSREEIAQALEAGILAFNVESEAEADTIAEVGRKLRRRAPIAIRVNPDVDASTHHYITTGKRENKFGIAFDVVRKLYRRLARHRSLELVGLHCHIGSQILDPAGFVAALDRMMQLLTLLRRDGHPIRLLNLGGGFGIAYEEGQKPMDVAALARKLMPSLRELDARLIFEPGRSIAGPAGFLLTRVHYIKPAHTKHFAIVDGAMNDLLRPSLYSAYHRIERDGKDAGRKYAYDIVGPICESGDFLGKDRKFGKLAPGDLLAVCDAGAYGMVMASNYNTRGRPAEVMVRGRNHDLVRERETLEDQLRGERLPAYLDIKAATRAAPKGRK